MVLQQVAHHQHLACPLRRRHGALSIRGGGGEGLLHEAVLARVGHAGGELGVGGHGGGEHHGVQVGVSEQLLEVRGRPRCRERLRHARAGLF